MTLHLKVISQGFLFGLLCLNSHAIQDKPNLSKLCAHADSAWILKSFELAGDINSIEIDSELILIHAARYSEPKLLLLALSNGANPDVGASREPPLIASQLNTECLAILLAYDADPYAYDILGKAAIHIMAEGGLNGTPKSGNERRKKAIATLIAFGCDVDARTSRGMTSLMLAAYRAYPPMIQFLLNFEANINAVDEMGETPLHKAALSSRKEEDVLMTVKLLIDSGADVRLKTKRGHTAFDFALSDKVKSLLSGEMRTDEVVEDLVGTWVSEIKRNEDWEPKPRTIGHYSDMAYAVEGMAEVYELNRDGSYVRTVTNPDYIGEGLVELIHCGVWNSKGGELRLSIKKTQLNAFGKTGYVLDVEKYNLERQQEGLIPAFADPTVFLLADDRASFELKYTDPSFRDGLDIVFWKQP